MSAELTSKLKNIKLIISDVDGILTDGTVFIGSDGTEFKQYTVEDGAGAAFSRLAGIPIALISGRYSKSTEIRASEMKIEKCYQGSLDKLTPFAEICEHYQVTPEEVVYIGDGLIDIPVMEKVAVSVSVPHAHFMVKELADHITQVSGGEGVLREVVEWILMAQGRHMDVLEKMKKTIYKA